MAAALTESKRPFSQTLAECTLERQKNCRSDRSDLILTTAAALDR